MGDNRELIGKIDAYLSENRDVILEDLKTLVRIPSILGEAVDGAPFGKACLDVLNKASELFSKAGCDSTVYGGKYGLASYGGGEKTIGLFGHCDVVPVGDDWIYTTPFEPIEIDGALIGRGVNDNKSGIVASLTIVKMLDTLGIKLNNKLLCYMGGNEETGMSDLAAFVQEQKMPDLSLVPDGSFPFGYGEKGMCRFWVEAPSAFEKIRSFKGGLAFNVVLDNVTVEFVSDEELYAELNEKTSGDGRYTVEKTGNCIVLRVKGVTRHAAMPEGSVNATWLAADMLKNVKSLPESDRKILQYAAYILDGYYGVNLGIDADDPTFGKLTCVNGMVDISNGKLRISFDSRFGTVVDNKVLVPQLKKTIGDAGWTFELYGSENGFLLEQEGNPVFGALRSVYREVSGDMDADGFTLSGGTYARKLKNAYSVGTQVPYKRVKLEMPPGHGSEHQSDEMLCIDAYLEAIKILALMVIECDRLI